MARPVNLLKFMPALNCRISFAQEAPLLVTGSVPGCRCITLQILRTSVGLAHSRALIDEDVAQFDEPSAAFCRLCWSKPLGSGGSSCPAGLIAGGLESGEVALWNPREALSDMPCPDRDEENFMAKLQEANSSYRDLELEYDFCELEKRQESPARPPLLEETTGNLVAAEPVSLDLQAPVARFSKHVGSICFDNRPLLSYGSPFRIDGDNLDRVRKGLANLQRNILNSEQHDNRVRGLEFSHHWPNLIGSGAENGRIMVWDLANPCAETVPTWQTESIAGDAISCISWSPLMPWVIGSTSLQGLNFWDTRTSKSPIKSMGLFPRRLSGIAFSGIKQNSVVVSYEDYLDTASLAEWDLRRMDKPVSELCENAKGVIAMAWSPHGDDALLVSTKNNELMIWNLEKQEIGWESS